MEVKQLNKRSFKDFPYSADIRQVVMLAAVLILIIILLGLAFYPQTLEDAFITFRYSEHLAKGYGIGAWNITGDKVEGYTSFLWMVVLAAGQEIGFSIETLSKILGILAQIGLVSFFLLISILTTRKAKREEIGITRLHPDVLLMSAIILALYLPLAWYATTGMETLLFDLLVALVLFLPQFTKNTALISFITVLVVLMRPEGIFFAIAINSYYLLINWHDKELFRVSVVVLLTASAAFIGLTLYRYIHFGDWLPNTYYAKVAGGGSLHISLGYNYLKDWVNDHPLFVLLFALAIIAVIKSSLSNGIKTQSFLLFLLSLCGVYFLYIIRSGGDNYYPFPYWRHVLHLMPVLAVILSIGLFFILPKSRYFRIIALLAILIVTDYHVLHLRNDLMLKDARATFAEFPAISNISPNPYYLWLKEISGKNTVIASAWGGELPYVVDAIHIDMLGLNDSVIAHTGSFDPNGPVDSKSNMSYVLNRHPDIIEGYVSADAILQNQPLSKIIRGRKQMVNDMLDDPIFQTQYMFLLNGPYEYIDRALFLRRSYYNSLPLKNQLECVPVLETALYQH